MPPYMDLYVLDHCILRLMFEWYDSQDWNEMKKERNKETKRKQETKKQRKKE